MCGRFAQALPAELLIRMFGAVDLRQEIARPSWNVAPATSVTAAAWDARRHRRVLVPMTWGLLAPLGEALGHRAAAADQCALRDDRGIAPVRAGLRRRRCLVAVDGWYEWAREGGQKVPHACGRADRASAVLGGIWECWKGPTGDRTLTLAIVTTPAAADLAAIHDRMPLVLDAADWPVWLGETEGDAAALMRPAPPGRIVGWRVGRAVGNPNNDGAQLLAAA